VDVTADCGHVIEPAGLHVDHGLAGALAEASARGAVLPAERQRRDEFGRVRARIRGAQHAREQRHRRALVARQARAVLQNQRARVDLAGLQERTNRLDALAGRTGRAADLGADGIDELARHHVVAVLVDAADHLTERPRAPHERRRLVRRDHDLAELAVELAADLFPERLEQTERIAIVLQDRAAHRIAVAAPRELAV
jgi:hypothetical protein